ncbi:MAG: helicase-related protein [Desulfobacterales bacterium]|nr:helicase-related protein [Desulfobacterales bacterium]
MTYIASAARVADTVAHDTILAPMEATVIPLPHQINALKKAISHHRIRYLLADEVGLGKTIEAGLILMELKLRGLVKRVIVLAPKGLVTQWVAEMKTHFNEDFTLLIPGDFSAIRQIFKSDNIWMEHNQVVCPVDSVKPIEKRKGWSANRIAEYNRDRFEDLITAGWDMVIVDEAHRLGGSTEQVARYKLGKSLSEASPYLLLLTATPHQGKTGAFHRLISLLDDRAFPDLASVSRERISPYVIRTEKRKAIDTKGLPLFQPRETKLIPIEWEDRHVNQKLLYEGVTDYVRRGYNQALKEKKGYIGFLMILMQRLVSSSTRAIRTTLERRLEVLKTSSDQIPLLPTDVIEDLEDLDAQEQLETLLNVRIKALKNEKAEVNALLEEAMATETTGPDAKAEVLLNFIYELMQKEGDPNLKILVFTEFIPTQQMLGEFLEERGFAATKLNGSMGLEERRKAQEAFSSDKQILISTDAGGEGLNLQFCHIVINYDLPWNPMRIEQRIGRVDRIGQTHPVKALNFIFEDTVEFHVRDVLEEKLETILAEFGVDKAGDVLDSVQAGQLFDGLYMDTLISPDDWEAKIESVVEQVRRSALDSRENTALFSPDDQLDPSAAEKLLSHPLPFWVEKMTLSYLDAYGGRYEKNRDGAAQTWNLTWPDGDSMQNVFFALRENMLQANGRYLSLENNKIRGLSLHLPRFVSGQPIPYVSLAGLSPDIKGFWSLWDISLRAADWEQRKCLPLFIHDDGRNLIPTANYLWDLMISETPAIYTFLEGGELETVFDRLRKYAEESGKPIFEELVRKHQDRLAEEREKTQYSFKSRRSAINRLGLAEVRAYRLSKLELEAKQFHLEMQKKEQIDPELKPLIIVHVQG